MSDEQESEKASEAETAPPQPRIGLAAKLFLGTMALLFLLTMCHHIGRLVSTIQYSETNRGAEDVVNQMAGAMVSGHDLQRVNPGAKAGPVARLLARLFNMMVADSQSFNELPAAVELPMVISFEGLTPISPVLDHCDRIAALAPRAVAVGARYPVYVAVVRNEGAAMIARGEIDQDEFDRSMAKFLRGEAGARRQWNLTAEVTLGGAELCRILARRRWHKAADGTIVFNNDGDLRAMTVVRARMQPILAEIAANETKARTTAARGLAKLRSQY